MISTNIFTKIFDKLLQVFLFALILFIFNILTANQSVVFGQPKLGDTVYKKSTDETNKQKASKKKPKPSVANNNQAANKTVSTNVKKSTPKNFVDVTFLSKEPSVEVILNDKSIGFTDEKLQLSKKISPGEYLVMAKNKRQVLYSTRRINISPEQTSFKLFEEIIPKPTPKVEPTPTVTEKSPEEKAFEVSEKIKKILEDYMNPATFDTVTNADWQLVFENAPVGQLQGYTAVQIEAQRWFASGQIELARNDLQSASTAFSKSQEFMPTSPLPFFGLGNTYFADKRYADALKLYQKALQIDPKLAMIYKRLGDTQKALGREKEAIAAYKNALQMGYNTLETRFQLASLLLETKQIEDGIKELEAVSKEMPKAEVFISIGNGYEKLKRDVSAIEFYQKAIDADPNSALAYYKLADVYLGQREYTKAKEAYEKALSLDPEGKIVSKPEAQKKLRDASNKLNK